MLLCRVKNAAVPGVFLWPTCALSSSGSARSKKSQGLRQPVEQLQLGPDCFYAPSCLGRGQLLERIRFMGFERELPELLGLGGEHWRQCWGLCPAWS